jgi:hypothetical protein
MPKPSPKQPDIEFASYAGVHVTVRMLASSPQRQADQGRPVLQ